MINVQILVDNPNSWIIPYAKILVDKIKNMGHKCFLLFKHNEVKKGDILCLLSWTRVNLIKV